MAKELLKGNVAVAERLARRLRLLRRLSHYAVYGNFGISVPQNARVGHGDPLCTV